MIATPDKLISRNRFFRLWDLSERLGLVRFFGSFGVSSWLCSDGSNGHGGSGIRSRKSFDVKSFVSCLRGDSSGLRETRSLGVRKLVICVITGFTRADSQCRKTNLL